jgi:6-phosphofructokinase 1
MTHHPLYHPSPAFFISATDVVLRDILFDAASTTSDGGSGGLAAYHRAGPRREVTFDPARVRAAIVTCGGLCPGTNTVVRELVVGLWELYGVRAIFGVRNGYRGFYSEEEEEPLPLEPATVHHWHKVGGTVLGTSRGGFDLARIVDAIDRRGFNQVYAIGGDGTMRGLVKIFEEVRRRGLPVAVAGVPKTVDNDVGIIDRSFGFHTAVEATQRAIAAAHMEAESAANGVGS